MIPAVHFRTRDLLRLLVGSVLGLALAGCTEEVIVRQSPTTQGATVHTMGPAVCALLFRCDEERATKMFGTEEACAAPIEDKCPTASACAAAIDASECHDKTPAVCEGCL